MKLFLFLTLLAAAQANFFRHHRGKNGFLGAGKNHNGTNFHAVFSLENPTDFDTLNISYYNCGIEQNVATCMASTTSVTKTNIGATTGDGSIKYSNISINGLNVYNVEYRPSVLQNHVVMEIETPGQTVLEETYICSDNNYVNDNGGCSPCSSSTYAPSGAITCTSCAAVTVASGTCSACTTAVASGCTAVACDANKFDTDNNAANGCEAGCAAVTDGTCSACTTAVASGCTSISSCATNKFDTNGNATDGCEAGCPTVASGTCDTCSDATTCTGVTCSANKFDTNGDATDGCEAGCAAVTDGTCSACTTAVASGCTAVTCSRGFIPGVNLIDGSAVCIPRSHMYGYVDVPVASTPLCTSGCTCQPKCVSWRGNLKDGFTIAERTSQGISVLLDGGVDKPLCDLLKKGGRLIKQQGC